MASTADSIEPNAVTSMMLRSIFRSLTSCRKPKPSMPGIRRSHTARRAWSFSSRNSRAFLASSKVRTASPAFSRAMAIDSREPVSSSITSTRGLSVMRGPFWHRWGADAGPPCSSLVIDFRLRPMTLLFNSSPADAAATLHGVLERIVFANEENAWSVVRLTIPGQRDPVTAVGNLLGVQPGENLRLTGSWINDPKYGKQFRVATYATVAPATLIGIEKYLGSGLIRGIGKVMASRLVKTFGLETLEVIENQPRRLVEVEGIGPKRSRDILRTWSEQREIKEVMIFLQSHGVSTAYAIKIYKTYGPQATELVRQNPYRLAADVYGIGFKTADSIASALGIPPDAPQRIEAGTLHLLGQAADRGHLYLPRKTLIEEAEKLLEAPADRVERALAALAETEQIVLESLVDPTEQA